MAVNADGSFSGAAVLAEDASENDVEVHRLSDMMPLKNDYKAMMQPIASEVLPNSVTMSAGFGMAACQLAGIIAETLRREGLQTQFTDISLPVWLNRDAECTDHRLVASAVAEIQQIGQAKAELNAEAAKGGAA